ncbi:MAG: hypothetical protein ACXVB9_08580 [Bdellovibrionota bacterium]
MRIRAILAFQLVAWLTSNQAHAVFKNELNSEALEKKLAAAESWKDLHKQFQPFLPKNILQEEVAESEYQVFPKILNRESGLEIKNQNGGKLKIKLGPNGRVFFNDVEWNAHPLAKTQDEVQRIMDLMGSGRHGAASLFDHLIPSAFAATSSPGVALAAQSISTGWKAKSCGDPDLSTDQNKSCPLMAVAMAAPQSQDPKKYIPISLKCPGESGTLELISKNYLGEFQRIRITYKAHTATNAEISNAPKDAPFHIWESIDLVHETNSTLKSIGQIYLNRGDALNAGVCNADDQSKKRYFASLDDNRAMLRKAEQDGSSPEGSGQSDQAI